MLTLLYISKELEVGAKGPAPAPYSVMVGDFAMLFTIPS